MPFFAVSNNLNYYSRMIPSDGMNMVGDSIFEKKQKMLEAFVIFLVDNMILGTRKLKILIREWIRVSLWIAFRKQTANTTASRIHFVVTLGKSNLCGVIKMNAWALNIKRNNKLTLGVSHYKSQQWNVLHAINFVLMLFSDVFFRRRQHVDSSFFAFTNAYFLVCVHRCSMGEKRPHFIGNFGQQTAKNEKYCNAHTSSRNGRIKTATSLEKKKEMRRSGK